MKNMNVCPTVLFIWPELCHSKERVLLSCCKAGAVGGAHCTISFVFLCDVPCRTTCLLQMQVQGS